MDECRRWLKRTVMPIIAVVGMMSLVIGVGGQSAPVVHMGDLVQSAQWDLSVRSIERLRGPLPTSVQGEVLRPHGQFIAIVVDLSNRTNHSLRPVANDFVLQSANGQIWTNISGSAPAETYATTYDFARFSNAIAPGASTTTTLVFDANPTAGRFTLSFRLAPDQSVQLDECHCNLPLPIDLIP